jgi:hypothetical protein
MEYRDARKSALSKMVSGNLPWIDKDDAIDPRPPRRNATNQST